MILHIHNGGVAAGVAKESFIPGEHFEWREALIDGPAPLSADENEWRLIRAQHLSEAYGMAREEIERESVAQEKKLASFSKYEEVVLWFEHDLFCQLHLVYLLNWFARRDLGKTRLTLVCIGSFPGRDNFRGLGELTPEEFSSLLPARQEVTRAQFDLAVRAWAAYRSPDPRDIETVLENDTGALPFLAPALHAHLRRFPSTTNGLGRIENRGLQLVASESNTFQDLFQRFGEVEPVYGLGDTQFWQSLRRLADANQPLLQIDGTEVSPEAAIQITPLGRAVAKGEGDSVVLNGIDHWLGGVYLADERNLWRWNEEEQRIVQT